VRLQRRHGKLAPCALRPPNWPTERQRLRPLQPKHRWPARPSNRPPPCAPAALPTWRRPNRHSFRGLNSHRSVRRGFLPRGLCDTCPQFALDRRAVVLAGRYPTTLNRSRQSPALRKAAVQAANYKSRLNQAGRDKSMTCTTSRARSEEGMRSVKSRSRSSASVGLSPSGEERGMWLNQSTR
jgi:hypothetical protein